MSFQNVAVTKLTRLLLKSDFVAVISVTSSEVVLDMGNMFCTVTEFGQVFWNAKKKKSAFEFAQ